MAAVDTSLSDQLQVNNMKRSYLFWNNKGGTGKTSLAFQTIAAFANEHSNLRILAVDVCPQANLSELLLGGLEGHGSSNLLKVQGKTPRATIGGYFQMRLPLAFGSPSFSPENYIINPSRFNQSIPANIDLLAGDPLLELQSNAMATLANTNIPGTDTWIGVVSWLKDFFEKITDNYHYNFLDANPSFSIYTQTAVAAVDRIILPVMADDSSRRAIQNAFSLIYGLKLPSEIYSQHNFSTRMDKGGKKLPSVHLVVKNRITQYMGNASGYRAVLESIDSDLGDLLKTNPKLMTFNSIDQGLHEIRDFQTTGVVAFARGTPFFRLKAGKRDVGDRRITIDAKQIIDRKHEIDGLAAKLL